LEKNSEYLLSLVALVALSTTALAALGQSGLDVYISVYVVSYFAASAVFAPRRRAFDFLGAGLFIVFCVVVALRVLEILAA
jgi:hypothetical protein